MRFLTYERRPLAPLKCMERRRAKVTWRPNLPEIRSTFNAESGGHVLCRFVPAVVVC